MRAPIVPREIAGLTILTAGITGAAITLFANLLAPLDMADWAWWLVQNWQDATPLVWDRMAAWLGAEMPSVLVPPLTMAVFLVTTAVGVGMRARRIQAPDEMDYPTLQLSAAMAALLVIGYLLLHPASASAVSGMPSEAPLAIFLAGAAISFSPIAAGRGNLTIKLWLVLLGTGMLLAVNELTKLAMSMFT